jgi:hypothetical protein
VANSEEESSPISISLGCVANSDQDLKLESVSEDEHLKIPVKFSKKRVNLPSQVSCDIYVAQERRTLAAPQSI